MTQRSIQAGIAPNVLIKAGGSVTVKAHESDRVVASTAGKWGLKVEKRQASEIARARAAIGEHVLFDLRLKLPTWEGKSGPQEVIEIQLGGNGEVWVPFAANLKVYAGKNIDVQGVRGQVDAYAGFRLNLQSVRSLGHASSGWAMNLDCERLVGERAEFKAGSDLRFQVHELTNALIRVKDIGGYWEARLGEGEKDVTLKSGGDVTLVTDQEVVPLPPNFVLGKVEKRG